MEAKFKRLFFDETLRRWHFGTIVREAGVSRERVHHFLKKLCKEKFIKRVKPQGKMPYYIANRDLPSFRAEKRLFGLQQLEELFSHLTQCTGVTTAILFGSFARGDWSKSSDIDLFIYGDDSQFEKGKFETKLGREIQVFSYNNSKKVQERLDPKVIPNIIKGFHITESIEPFEVTVHA